MVVRDVPTVVLSAGHWPGGPGVTANRMEEHAIVAQLGFYVSACLQQLDVPFKLVESDTLKTKIRKVNEISEALTATNTEHFALELHMNSSPDPAFNGASCYHYPHNVPGKEMAEILVRNLRYVGLKNRGAKTPRESNLGKLAWIESTRPTALLLECLFLTNSADSAILQEPRRLLGLANRLAIGIEECSIYLDAYLLKAKTGNRRYDGIN